MRIVAFEACEAHCLELLSSDFLAFPPTEPTSLAVAAGGARAAFSPTCNAHVEHGYRRDDERDLAV